MVAYSIGGSLFTSATGAVDVVGVEVIDVEAGGSTFAVTVGEVAAVTMSFGTVPTTSVVVGVAS